MRNVGPRILFCQQLKTDPETSSQNLVRFECQSNKVQFEITIPAKTNLRYSPMLRQMRSRETLRYFFVAAATTTLLVCGCQESNQVDCQVVGHSMATAFKSEHSVFTCDHCGFRFACDVVEPHQSGPPVICGNCGTQIDKTGVVHDADQAKLTRGQPVKRWDVVAFRRGDRILVKRVIGLPGEIVDFRKGNLLINEQMVRRSPVRWREVAVPVFDSVPGNANANSMKLFERLVPREKSNWSVSAARLVHQSKQETNATPPNSEFDFLDYRHRRCYKNSNDLRTPVAIDDVYSFNQSIRRTPHPINELDVRIKVSFANQGAIRLERKTPKATISATVELQDDQTVALQLIRRSGGDIETVENKGIKVSSNSIEVRLVNFDDSVHLFIDGKEYLSAIRFESIENPDRSDVDVSHPVVSIGVSRGDLVTIERVSIWRDWYLFQDSPKPSVRLPLNMGKQGYYVVGDNLPVSEDSRHFGAVHDIIGVVQPVDRK